MNAQQKAFYDYVFSIIQPGKEAEAKKLLEDNFKLMDAGKLTKETVTAQGPQLIALLQPAHQAEFLTKMSQFTGGIK